MTRPEAFERVGDQVLEAIEAGVSIADAGRASDVAPRTIYRWLARGREEREGPFASFAQAVDRSREDRSLNKCDKPLDEHDLRLRISEAARAGSVAAMRLYWEILKSDRHDPASEDDPLAGVDELARRRAQTRGAPKAEGGAHRRDGCAEGQSGSEVLRSDRRRGTSRPSLRPDNSPRELVADVQKPHRVAPGELASDLPRRCVFAGRVIPSIERHEVVARAVGLLLVAPFPVGAVYAEPVLDPCVSLLGLKGGTPVVTEDAVAVLGVNAAPQVSSVLLCDAIAGSGAGENPRARDYGNGCHCKPEPELWSPLSNEHGLSLVDWGFLAVPCELLGGRPFHAPP